MFFYFVSSLNRCFTSSQLLLVWLYIWYQDLSSQNVKYSQLKSKPTTDIRIFQQLQNESSDCCANLHPTNILHYWSCYLQSNGQAKVIRRQGYWMHERWLNDFTDIYIGPSYLLCFHVKATPDLKILFPRYYTLNYHYISNIIYVILCRFNAAILERIKIAKRQLTDERKRTTRIRALEKRSLLCQPLRNITTTNKLDL